MNGVFKVLDSAHYAMVETIRVVPDLPVTERQKREAVRDYRIILRCIAQAQRTQTGFDIMRALWYYLELWKGQIAYAKGPQAYKNFQKKWNAPQYKVFYGQIWANLKKSPYRKSR